MASGRLRLHCPAEPLLQHAGRGAIAQSNDATDAGGEIAALRQLLDRVELDGVLVQADALHANCGFFATSSSAAPTS